ncbi:alkaline phosphatase family protein, partial [Kibdelosporangium lantanae]
MYGVGALASAAVLAVVTGSAVGPAEAQPLHRIPADWYPTITPIKHVVVIFGENISFDHYFGTYPNAANTDGTPFHAARDTPKVNGLSQKLLTDNPNAYNPKRLTHEQAMTCDQNHNYGAEQAAFNGGKMDKFVEKTETDKCTGQPILFGEPGLVMDYYDGNTVTAMWNYAQHYALSDNSFNTVFGPSTPGAINLISGNTHGVQALTPVTHEPTTDPYTVVSPDANGIGTMINDPDPAWDDCSGKNHTSKDNLATMHGRNIGDLLNERHITWGWFQGGFRPTGTANGFAVCGQS